MFSYKLSFQRSSLNISWLNRWFSFTSKLKNSFNSNLKVNLAALHQRKSKADFDRAQFGKSFTDHMLQIYYYGQAGGWQAPEIVPLNNVVLHPATKALHYGIQTFEGMKTYRGIDGEMRLFRPKLHMFRLIEGARRACLPMFNEELLISCISNLISVDKDWAPYCGSSSLYIRATMIGTDATVGITASLSAMMFVIASPVDVKASNDGISLFANPDYKRSWAGSCGNIEMGSNYAPTVTLHEEAARRGLHEVLWLQGCDDYVTQTTTMNVFMVIVSEDGRKELVTPPLDGNVIPGVMRQSVLELARELKKFKVSERCVSVSEITQLINENRLLEFFCSGTVSEVSPVVSIHYRDVELKIPTLQQQHPVYLLIKEKLSDIQYGCIKHSWAVKINDY